MASSNDIRATFLDYFARNGHQVVESSPLVPRNDPTLMFVNSGMVQFKNVFTGQERRPYSRATTAQKCVRAGGKHNDLDNVGYTARHHTFFEMLGNFSFGDYFKDVAIEYAWELLTKDFGIDKSRLLVTVFNEDDDAAKIWKKVAGLPDERIIPIATSDNFWRMGDTGPCGPCSEIFYDHGPEIPGGPPGSPDEDGDRFIEIWNLVFMQLLEGPPGTRVPLPRPSIDTGMGLERFAAILQGKHDNYDTDTLRALILASAEASGQDPDGPFRASHRVIADHLRSSAFLIADGVLPSNEGRGYVLRRIMRRAMRHATMMGAREPVMYRLVPALVRQMGAAYPELVRAEPLIVETLLLEETRFKHLLERGLHLLAEETTRLGDHQALPGAVAFRLYDTFGFPLDLTQDALREQGRTVDLDGFNSAMAEQRARARAAWAGSGEAATESVWFEIKERVGSTEFLGYSTEASEGVIQAIVAGGVPVQSAGTGTEVAVVLNQTPFYGESGGQVGDTGMITSADGFRIRITDTQKKLSDLVVHLGVVEAGVVTVDAAVVATVDHARRTGIRAHHSATHLLHEALRRELGTHVAQKGSLNAPDRLRFDISQPRPITADELTRVEAVVNARIRENSEVTTRLMTPEAAVETGAMALFGEKYGDEVRVVSMGAGEGNKSAWSIELCGGTHVRRTGDIGYFRIVAESAVAAGVRRIEAVTGAAAETLVLETQRRLNDVAGALRAAPADVPERVMSLLDERRRLESTIGDLRRQLATGGSSAAVEQVNGIPLSARDMGETPARDLKGLAEAIGKQMGSGVVALVSSADGKASIVVGVSQDLMGRVNAVDLVRKAAAAVGGKGGGGRPEMAQAGGLHWAGLLRLRSCRSISFSKRPCLASRLVRTAESVSAASHSPYRWSADMANIAIDSEPDLRMSREEYRRWAGQRPSGRFERIDGVVVAMAPERANHADRKALIWLALRQAVAATGLPCHAYPDGMTVEVDDNDFEPDAVLRCGPPLSGDAIAVPDPLVVVEVLSPGTRGDDLHRKLVAYFRVPSIQHYLVLWADRPQVLHHRRQADGESIETRVMTGGTIVLDPPGITIAVEDLYGE